MKYQQVAGARQASLKRRLGSGDVPPKRNPFIQVSTDSMHANQIVFAAVGPEFLQDLETIKMTQMKSGLDMFNVFFIDPEVLDIMATLSNLAVRAAAFATTYPECLHWKYRQRWVGDMVIYGSILEGCSAVGPLPVTSDLTLHRGVFWAVW